MWSQTAQFYHQPAVATTEQSAFTDETEAEVAVACMRHDRGCDTGFVTMFLLLVFFLFFLL